MTQRTWLQFRIGTLLAATALCATFTAAVVSYGLDSFFYFLLFMVVSTGAAFAIAWTMGDRPEASQRLVLPLVAFNLVNWAAWHFSRVAFWCMTKGLEDRTDVSVMAEWLLDAARFHAFDAIAVASTCITVFAAWRKNKALLRAAGATTIWLWLIIFCVGFAVASVHLIEMP